jgi:hypothetical protein
MTSEDVKAELEKHPFTPFRIHLVSGKTIDVRSPADGWMLQNAVTVFQNPQDPVDASRYDVVALRNVERLAQLSSEGGP